MNISFTPQLARIYGDITGDSHLQLQDWRGLTSFYSKDMTAIHSMNKRFQKVFGIHGRVYEEAKSS